MEMQKYLIGLYFKCKSSNGSINYQKKLITIHENNLFLKLIIIIYIFMR